MANLILGLLMIRSLTIYEIKITLERKISPFFAASLGAIQIALKKLLASGSIIFAETIDHGRRKKIYSITTLGKEQFLSWMHSDIPVNKFNNEALLRVFFFGFIPAATRITLLKKFIAQLNEIYNEMLDFQQTLTIPNSTAQVNTIAAYQLETLDYGIQETMHELHWYQGLLTRIEKENK
jgi:DNA-binding PadR family transcriptional regulator